MTFSEDLARAKLDNLRQYAKTIRKSRFYCSRLDRFKNELLTLREVGASLSELALFLRTEKRTVVCRSTISRWLKKQQN